MAGISFQSPPFSIPQRCTSVIVMTLLASRFGIPVKSKSGKGFLALDVVAAAPVDKCG